MNKFLYNFDNDDILYFIQILDNEMNNLNEKYSSLKDFKNILLDYISNNREE